MKAAPGPQHLSDVLAELIALRGLSRRRADTQLQEVWANVVDERVALQTRVLGIRRGVLQIGVSNAALLSELVGFQKSSLLNTLQREHPDLQIGDLKFRLRGDLVP